MAGKQREQSYVAREVFKKFSITPLYLISLT